MNSVGGASAMLESEANYKDALGRKYDGRDPYLPLYFAVKGEIFDVSKGRDFYGPGDTAASPSHSPSPSPTSTPTRMRVVCEKCLDAAMTRGMPRCDAKPHWVMAIMHSCISLWMTKSSRTDKQPRHLGTNVGSGYVMLKALTRARVCEDGEVTWPHPLTLRRATISPLKFGLLCTIEKQTQVLKSYQKLHHSRHVVS